MGPFGVLRFETVEKRWATEASRRTIGVKCDISLSTCTIILEGGGGGEGKD